MTRRRVFDRTLALRGSAQKGLNQLDVEHGVDIDPVYGELVDVRNSVIEMGERHGIVDAEESTWQKALRRYDVQAHVAETNPGVVDDAEAKFRDGQICKLTFQTHHAPHYVMMLENGYFIAMTAPVENTPGDNRPFGISEAKLNEHLENDRVQVNWLEKDDSPFGHRGDQ